MKNRFGWRGCLSACVLIGLLAISCKKAVDWPEPSRLDEISMEGVRSENVGQWGFRVNYKLNGPVGATGVCISADSSVLVGSTGEEVAAMVVVNSNYAATVDFPSFPKANKIFYKIYVQDATGYRRYSQVYGHRLASMVVRNPYIVHGMAVHNTHTTESFSDYDEGPYGWFDNSLSIMSALNDIAPENYRAVLNGKALHLATVLPGTKREIRHRLIFDVPQEIPFGDAKLELYHRDALVATEQVHVVAGGLINKQTRYFPEELKGNYASYAGEVYNYAASGTPVPRTQFFYKWTPGTNQWAKLPDPPTSVPTWYGNGMQELDGTLYLFPHVTSENSPRFFVEEYMITYHIASGQWRKKILYSGHDFRQALEVQDSFVYQGKVYWIATVPNTSILNDVIMSYDPSTETYERFYQLPYLGDATYKATVLDGKVYLLRSSTRSYMSSIYTNASEFFELDMSGKKLIAKPWFVDKVRRQWIIANGGAGYLEPYIVGHQGKIYAYGGKLRSEYFDNHMTLFVVYDPTTDQWSPVSDYSYYTARVSQTEGQMLSLNGKLYLFHGINGEIHHYSSGRFRHERHGNIYTLDVR